MKVLPKVFQPYRGNFEALLSFGWNLDTKISATLRILMEPCKELAELRLKNTGLTYQLSGEHTMLSVVRDKGFLTYFQFSYYPWLAESKPNFIRVIR